MTETPKDRAALFLHMATAVIDYVYPEDIPEEQRAALILGEVKNLETALRAAEDVGVSMQPDEPTEEMRKAKP